MSLGAPGAWSVGVATFDDAAVVLGSTGASPLLVRHANGAWASWPSPYQTQTLGVALASGGATLADGTVYLVGGEAGQQAKAEVYAVRAGGASTQLPSLPTARSLATAFVHAQKLFVLGGTQAANDSALNLTGTQTVDWLDLDAPSAGWRAGPPLPEARFAAAGAIVGGAFHLVGGADHTTLGLKFVHTPARAFKLDLSALTWSDLTPMSAPRARLTAGVWGPYLLAWGGAAMNAVSSFQPVARFDVYDTRDGVWHDDLAWPGAPHDVGWSGPDGLHAIGDGHGYFGRFSEPVGVCTRGGVPCESDVGCCGAAPACRSGSDRQASLVTVSPSGERGARLPLGWTKMREVAVVADPQARIWLVAHDEETLRWKREATAGARDFVDGPGVAPPYAFAGLAVAWLGDGLVAALRRGPDVELWRSAGAGPFTPWRTVSFGAPHEFALVPRGADAVDVVACPWHQGLRDLVAVRVDAAGVGALSVLAPSACRGELRASTTPGAGSAVAFFGVGGVDLLRLADGEATYGSVTNLLEVDAPSWPIVAAGGTVDLASAAGAALYRPLPARRLDDGHELLSRGVAGGAGVGALVDGTLLVATTERPTCQLNLP